MTIICKNETNIFVQTLKPSLIYNLLKIYCIIEYEELLTLRYLQNSKILSTLL